MNMKETQHLMKGDFIKTLKQTINNSYLKEVGDLKNVRTITYKQNSDGTYEFASPVGIVEVDFVDFDVSEWENVEVQYKDFDYNQPIKNVVYSVNGDVSQYTKAEVSTLMQIIATVAKIVQEYIEANNPYALLLVGADKTGLGTSDKQKNSLYLAVASNNLPSGYRISNITIDDGGVVVEGKIVFKR